jgi:FkbM family methyltransferase
VGYVVRAKVSYSQNDEEKVIGELFAGFTGKLLDIGATDGILLSNTRKLLENGWRGVLVEPCDRSFLKLRKNCSFLNGVILIQAAVSDTTGLKRFWIDETVGREWSATINRGLLELGSVVEPFPNEVYVPSITMADLAPFGPYDFISMDAEWEDLAILTSQPKVFWRQAKVICVEARDAQERAITTTLLLQMGFTLVHETKENIIVKRVD